MKTDDIRLLMNSIIRRRRRGLSIDDGSWSSEILDAYSLVRVSGMNPDNYTYPYVLKACAYLGASEQATSIHAHILKSGYGAHLHVANSLIHMYAQLGSLSSAHRVFHHMTTRRNLVSWNSIISAYALHGFPHTAIQLFTKMQSQAGLGGFDRVSLKILLPACGLLKASRLGKSAHAHLITSGFISDVALATSLIDMYARCSDLDAAKTIFCGISSSVRDVVSWNAMMNGYLQAGELWMVLDFFRRLMHMHDEEESTSVSPNIVTLLVVLQACTGLAVLQTAESIHGYIVRVGLASDVSIATLLVDMYSKCGELSSACWVFNEISRGGGGTVNSWSAMINGLGMHGHGEAAIMCFFGMLKRGILPDEICFLLVLSGCSHNGLVEEGHKIFEYMVRNFGIRPTMEHYATLVDALGRAGLIDKAREVINGMPVEPNIDVWSAFLGACRIHDDYTAGGVAGERLLELGPNTAGYYKLLLGSHVGKGKWDEVAKIRRLITERVLESTSGCSFIQMKS